MVLGWGTASREPGVDPYAQYDTYKTTPEGQRYRGNRPGFDWGDVGSFFKDDLLGVDDWRRAGEAWRQGDARQLAKSVGTGFYELGTTLAAPFTGGTSLLARTATGTGTNILAPLALGIGAGASGWQPAAQNRAQQERFAMDLANRRSEQAQAARYQGLADQFQASQTQGGAVVAPQTQGGAETSNRFSRALGLTPAQTEQFQRQLNQAELERDRILGDLGSEESRQRRLTQQMARGTRASGAGSMADLQQSAAARGLMASPASYDVGRGQIGANVASAQARQQANLADIVSQIEGARGQTTSDYRSFLNEIARQRLETGAQNERDAISQLLSRFQQ